MRLRQWQFTPEFRIACDAERPELEAWRALLGSARSAVPVQPAAAAPAAVAPRTPAAALDTDAGFVVELANVCFRLQRTAQELSARAAGSEESRRVSRSVQNLDQLLKDHSIECLDLEGEPYDDGRRDFEPMPPPVDSESVTDVRIGRCERPRVLRDGKLLQKGKGRILRPATKPVGRGV
jgi:hypothetical protein